MRVANVLVVLVLLVQASPLAAQTPEQWADWGGRVHGGFGSMIAWGIRVGLDAAEELGAERRQVAVEYLDALDAPCACVADGIAIAVSASVGQRTLTVVRQELPAGVLGRVTFTHRTTGTSITWDLPSAAMGPMDEVNRDFRGAERFNAVMAMESADLYRPVE